MCRICSYNQVQHLDRALLAGAAPAELGRRYAFTVPEIERHQQHLQQKMARTEKRFHDLLNLGLYCKLNNLMEILFRVIRTATKGEDAKLFLQSSREFTRIISLMDKIAARLQVDPEFLYCLLADHQWDLQEGSLLPDASQALAKSRQTLKRELFTPCPEPASALSPAATKPGEAPASPTGPNSGPVARAAALLAARKEGEPPTDDHGRHERDTSATQAPKIRASGGV